MEADLARPNFSVSGSGVTVGILSDSFDCSGNGSYAADQASGDLPAGVNILDDTATDCTDEGRAMAQIVHDVAPDAGLAFHTAFNGQADFAQGIKDLAAAGADIIVDDVFYYAEPMFQDGVIAQAADTVNASGVAYFSAAGNNGRQAYESTFRPCDKCGSLGGAAHDFNPDPAVVDARMKLRLTSDTIFVLQWSNPFFSVSGPPGATTDLDICFYSPANSGTPFFCSADDNLGLDPVEGVLITLPLGETQAVIGVGIERFAGPNPSFLKLVMYGDVQFRDPVYFGTGAGTVVGHANASGADAVGASAYFLTPEFGEDPPVLNYYSSAGTTTILFDTAGRPTKAIRGKPEFTAPDGGNNTFFGFDYEPDGFPNFFGTSAAAPHAAGVAALLLEDSPSLTPAEVTLAFQRSAVDMVAREPRLPTEPRIAIGSGCDKDSGAGLINAVDAFNYLGAPWTADLVGTWRPSSTTFFLDALGAYRWDNCGIAAPFGVSTDIPLSGDWDGDGTDEVGVWRPSNTTFYLDVNGNFKWDPGVDASGKFGVSTDIPLAGDWDGDGTDEIGVWRPSNKTFYLDYNGNYAWDIGIDKSGVFGLSTDKPLAGDWDGDGDDQIGVWRPSNKTFYLDYNGNYAWDKGIDKSGVFGLSTDIPVSGDWDGDGDDQIGVWRPSNTTFYLDANGNYAWDLGVDFSAVFGVAGDKPVVGTW